MIWKCKSCQSEIEIPDGTDMRFCPKCGAKAEEKSNEPGGDNLPKTSSCPVCCTEIQEGDDIIVCPDCKMVYHKDCWHDNNGCATYGCPSAGCLNPPPMKVDVQDGSSAQTVNANHGNSAIRCPQCNTQLEAGATFCWSCGADLGASGVVASNAPLAGPWERWAARIIDFTLEVYIIDILAAIILDNSTYNSIPTSTGSIIYAPFAFLIDSAVYAATGGTLGKWLFGVKVVKQTNSAKISAGEYFYRNLRVYWGGLGLGIPLVSFFTTITQYNRVSKGEPATYDDILKMKSVEHNKKWYKTFFGVLLLIALLVLGAAARVAAK